MTLFAGRARQHLVRALQRDIRLLLPADPGREQLLEYVHLFDPRARLASQGGINVDNMREVYLTRSSAIEPDVAAEAGVPEGMGVAFFVSNVARARPFSPSDVNRKTKEQYDTSVRLVNGLAIRLNGVAWPEASIMQAPLRATIYTPRVDVIADNVYALVAKYAPGIQAYNDVTLDSINVSTWRTQDHQFEAEFWPIGKTSMMPDRVPLGIGDMYYKRSGLSATLLQLSTPGSQADPTTARLLGECALEVAAATSGVCTDQLGFQVTRPDDLVFR